MDAIALTRFMPQKTAADVGKLLQSVAANAENNYDMDPEDLWIKAIYADGGPRFAASRRRQGPLAASSGTHTTDRDRRGAEKLMGRKVNWISSGNRHRLGIKVVCGAELHRAAS